MALHPPKKTEDPTVGEAIQRLYKRIARRHGKITEKELWARYSRNDLSVSAFLRRPLPPLLPGFGITSYKYWELSCAELRRSGKPRTKEFLIAFADKMRLRARARQKAAS